MTDYGYPLSTVGASGYPMSSTTMLTSSYTAAPNVAPSAGAGSMSSAMGYASIFSSIIGAIGSASLARTQAKGTQSALNFQSDMMKINARMAERSAQSVLLQGQQQVANLTLRSGKIKSAQRVALAANGVDLGEGNAAEIQATTDLMTELDKNTIEANAVRSAWGYRTQGVNASNQALMSSTSAQSINPNNAAMSSLMGSAGNVAQSWYAMNKYGAFN
jgi:hypothetical protein